MTNTYLVGKIAEKLRTISPHDLQVLAEEYAQIKFPSRFGKNLVRPGRNIDGQTTKGWPDAYVHTENNSIDAIEATRDRNNWERHLEQDYQRISGKEAKLSGFIFIAGYPDNEPPKSDVEAWQKKIAATGIATFDPSKIMLAHTLDGIVCC